MDHRSGHYRIMGARDPAACEAYLLSRGAEKIALLGVAGAFISQEAFLDFLMLVLLGAAAALIVGISMPAFF